LKLLSGTKSKFQVKVGTSWEMRRGSEERWEGLFSFGAEKGKGKKIGGSALNKGKCLNWSKED